MRESSAVRVAASTTVPTTAPTSTSTASPTTTPTTAPTSTPTTSPTTSSTASPTTTPTAAPAPALSLSRTQAPPDAVVRVRGLHFSATSPVTVSLNGAALVSATTTAAGRFVAPLTVPNLAPGAYPLSARDGQGLSSSVTFVVVARAPAYLWVYPRRAPPGATITVAGGRFEPGETVGVSFQGAQGQAVTTTATATGTILLTTTVPQLAPGVYDVTARGASSGQSASAPLRVIALPAPRLRLSRRYALPGTLVDVSGRDFGAAEPLTLTLGATVLTTTVADATGAFTTSFTVPVLASGPYALTVAGPAGAPGAATTFTVLAAPAPRLIVSRLTAPPFASVVVLGRNFGPTETVGLSLGATGVATATTTARGAFAARFTVPRLAPGLTTLGALGATSGVSVSVPFRVYAPHRPAFGLSRRYAVAGGAIAAQGAYFAPSEPISITIGATAGITTVATTTSSVRGTFSVTFTVPQVAPGAYLVAAQGISSGITATYGLRVVLPAAPTLRLARHTGLAGTIVPARGYHFGADETVTLSFSATVVATATTSAHGSFYARFTVPPLSRGTYAVAAVGGTSGLTATSFFVVRPAPYGVLSGTVTGSDSPVGLAGAIVHAVQQGTGRGATAITDASGAYRLRLRTGYWYVDATVRDGVHLRLPPVLVFVGASAVTVHNFVLPLAPALLEGSVFGPPSTAITVTAHSATDASQVVVTTDSSGHATYTLGARIGLWRIYAALPASARDAYDPPHSRAVAVTRVGTSADPVVYNTNTTLTFIAAPYVITVTVRDSAGAPVTSTVFVVATSPDYPNGGVGVGTSVNANGVYTLRVAGGDWEVRVYRRDGPSPLGQRLIVNAANPYVSLSFTLQAAPDTISGVVYDANGQPIMGAVVRAAADGEYVSVRSGAGGAYTLRVFPATWEVLAFAPQLGLVGRAEVAVAVGANPTQDFAAPRTYRVGGTVRVGASPLAFATLRAYAVNARNSAQTALDGTYSMLLPAAGYTMRGYAVQAGALGDDFFTVSHDIFDQDWTLPAQGRVHVTIAVGGVQMKDPTGTAARVSAWDPYTGYWNATSDAISGTYALPLIAGVYTVRVGVPGQGQLERRNVRVTPNGTLDVAFDFTRVGTVQGTVEDTTGAPIPGAAVFLRRGAIDVRTITDMHGYYNLHVQSGHTYTLEAEQPGYVLRDIKRVYVVAGATRTVNLTLAAALNGASGDALVAGTNSAPAVYAWIWATTGHGGYAQTHADGFGAWSLRLTPGRWAVRARFDGFATARPVIVDVPVAGRVTGVHLSLTAVPRYVAPLPAAAAFQAGLGVSVGTPDNAAEVIVPANVAGQGSATYSIDVRETGNVPDAANGAPLGGRGVEIAVSDGSGNPLPQLDGAMTVNLTYKPADLPAGVSPSALTVGYLDTATGTWQPLPCTVDLASHTVSVSTNQLGTFALLLPR